MNWEHILDKYGLAVAFLAVTIAAVYVVGRYAIWPLINRFMAATEAANQRLLDSLNMQVAEARAARMKDTQDFLSELRAQRQTFEGALSSIGEQKGRR